MPRKDLHDMIEKAALGYLTGMTDLMDAPVKQLHGHHRVLYHDVVQITILAHLKGGDFFDNLLAGLIHIVLDESFSEAKKELKNYGKYVQKARKKYAKIHKKKR